MDTQANTTINNNAAVDAAEVTANMISDTKIATGAVVLSYPHLLEAWSSGNDQKAKYTTQIRIDKGDKGTLDAIDKATQAAMEKGRQKFGSAFQGKKVALPLHDGVEKDDPDMEDKFYMNLIEEITVDGSTLTYKFYNGTKISVTGNIFTVGGFHGRRLTRSERSKSHEQERPCIEISRFNGSHEG